LEQLPEVESVGAAAVTPLTGNNWIVALERPERPLAPGQRPPEVGWQAASAGYFRALGIPLRAGRLFDRRDVPDGAPVVIVSDALAARHFPGENAVGKRVKLGQNEMAEIVGVVGSIRRASLADAPREDLYFPFEQGPSQGVTLFLRTLGDPLLAWPAVRTTIRDIERHAVLVETRTLDHIAEESAAITRLAMRLLAGFAAIALALAAVGIYGVMSYSVRRRTRELGTRVALGASRADIVRLVMRQAAILAAAGLTTGIVAGLAGARALSSVLFGVPAWDPVAIGAAATVLTVTAFIASYVPARRAARIDPASTLVSE
jgi:putative ABC transport system permease protein